MKMAPLFDSMDWEDEENDLSDPVAADTQTANQLAPHSSDNTASLSTRLIGGKTYLVVDQSANCRAGARVSGIWTYGLELRAMDHQFDKH
jgi:hypothetical protein